ncbi:MAG: glycosyltransferase family 4 protein [Acetobacteraceae bacterium]|nr:glycosyltransferase family 4 protein [Acetobacteraceae bacterium]
MTRIVFVLPVRGGGGAHSVVQEATALRDLGIEAVVAVNATNAEAFRAAYDRFDWLGAGGMVVFDGPRELAQHLAGAEVAVGTTNTSVHSIAEALRVLRGTPPRTAYYVQDYEPLFYAVGTTEHALALASFTVLRGCTHFAKTRWLAGLVRAAHGHETALVVPSIDHTIYRPAARRPGGGRPVVVAMVRPSTPRRAPRRTLALLGRVAAGEFGEAEAVAFGADAEEIAAHGMALPPGVRLAGRLRQTEVAELLRGADLFLDLSDYQAFGRTAAEAMASGCIVLAPRLGGASDFIADGIGGFLADTCDPAAVNSALRRMLSLSEAERRAMRLAGLEAVAGFTPVRAAISELRALRLA